MDLKDKNVQNILLGIVALLALIPVVWQRAHPEKYASKQKIVASAAVQKNERAKNVPQAAKSFRFSRRGESASTNLLTELAVSDAPEALNARFAPLALFDGRYSFEVRLITESRCMEGDFDIIHEELHYSSNPKLLLSLEPLGPNTSNFQAVTHYLKPAQFRPGTTYSFSFPALEGYQHVGLFLCLDSSESGSCKGKAVHDVSKITKRYIQGRSKRILEKRRLSDATDKLYFFNYFLLDRDRIIGFDTAVDNFPYDQAEQYLSYRLSDNGSSSEVMQQARALNEKIRSMPAEIVRRYITINLPRMEQGKCAERGIGIPPALQQAIERKKAERKRAREK